MAEFKLVVYSNAHYMDESEAYTLEGFDDYAQALQKAQTMVLHDLQNLCKPGMQAEELLMHYRMFGEDPVIVPAEAPAFSARNYAVAIAPEVCRNMKTIPLRVRGEETRVENIQISQGSYEDNKQLFLKNMVLLANYLALQCNPAFEVPLHEFLQTGRPNWYGGRSDIGGYQDYYLNYSFAYIPGNRFQCIHISVCESTGYDADESCVEVDALGLGGQHYVVVRANLFTGIATLIYSGFTINNNFTHALLIDEQGNITLDEKGLAASVGDVQLKPNDYFRNEAGFHVVVFKNLFYRDIRQAEILRGFQSYELAEEKARGIISASVKTGESRYAKTPEELYQFYKESGLCPVICSNSEECDFDAWAYARELAFKPGFFVPKAS